MNKVLILTDSTADLDLAYTLKEEVHSIPLFIRYADEVYKDGVDITTEELFKKVEETKEVARSTGLRSGDFHNAFNKFIKRGYDIVYIGIGSNLSSTVQSAMIAKQELETKQVHIVDSKSISCGLGLLVMRGVELKNQGLSAAEIKRQLDELVPRIHFYFMLSDIDLLRRTTRITKTRYQLAKLFHAKPIVTMINDRIELYKHPMGSLERKLGSLIRLVERKTKGYRIPDLMITHSTSEKIANMGYDLVQKRIKPTHLTMNSLGCVLGASTGRDAFGIAYIMDEQIKKA